MQWKHIWHANPADAKPLIDWVPCDDAEAEIEKARRGNVESYENGYRIGYKEGLAGAPNILRGQNMKPLEHFPYGNNAQFFERLNILVDAVNELRRGKA